MGGVSPGVLLRTASRRAAPVLSAVMPAFVRKLERSVAPAPSNWQTASLAFHACSVSPFHSLVLSESPQSHQSPSLGLLGGLVWVVLGVLVDWVRGGQVVVFLVWWSVVCPLGPLWSVGCEIGWGSFLHSSGSGVGLSYFRGPSRCPLGSFPLIRRLRRFRERFWCWVTGFSALCHRLARSVVVIRWVPALLTRWV